VSDLSRRSPSSSSSFRTAAALWPFHWGRSAGIALNNGKPELAEIMGNNIFFDTCVYHQPGIDLLTKVVPIDNILFASEMVGAVKGNDPKRASASTTQALCRQGANHRSRPQEDFRGQRAPRLSEIEGKAAGQSDPHSPRHRDNSGAMRPGPAAGRSFCRRST